MSGVELSAPELLEVGRVAKAHGLKGEVFVKLTSDRLERVATGVEFTTDKGPLRIVRSRPHQGQYLVVFEGLTDRNGAEALAGTLLFAEPIDDPDALWVHDLIGSRVVDTEGVDHGRCIAVLDNPAHALIELEGGALVPVVFVLDCVDGVTTIDPPDGLFDL